MAAIVGIVSGCDVSIHAHRGKVGVVDIYVHVSSHLKEELAWAVDKRLQFISTIFK